MIGQCGGDCRGRGASSSKITIDLGASAYTLLAVIKEIRKAALVDRDRPDTLHFDITDVARLGLTGMPGSHPRFSRHLANSRRFSSENGSDLSQELSQPPLDQNIELPKSFQEQRFARRHCSLAERGGFEPPKPVSQFNGLANRRYRPLSHLSVIAAVWPDRGKQFHYRKLPEPTSGSQLSVGYPGL
jgi:hypothetical protein